jgi:hypothetical protein
MLRNKELSGGYPELKQARINIYQRGAPEARKQSGIDCVLEVQKEIRSPKNRVCMFRCDADVLALVEPVIPLFILLFAACIQDSLSAHPVSLHSLEERPQHVGILVLITAAAETLQPIDITSQPAQSLRVLHVDQEVPPYINGIHDVAGRDNNSGHNDSL